MSRPEVTEGFVNFRGLKTYYIVYGDLAGGNTPLLALHGGPGYPHYHLENLSQLAEKGRPVVLYDQLGCGRSDRPDDLSLWTVELFVDELNTVRRELGLSQTNLLGHSWGGSLAAEYMLTRPTGISKLILSSPMLDSKLWVSEAKRLIAGLPAWAAELMDKHESAGTTDTYEYQQAYAEFKSRHVCRVRPYPMQLVRADHEMGAPVYNTLWGPSETHATGSLKDWTVLDRLHEITVPTLFLSGAYDEATPDQVKAACERMPGSKWVLFEHSSHTANFEEPEKYLGSIEKFLNV